MNVWMIIAITLSIVSTTSVSLVAALTQIPRRTHCNRLRQLFRSPSFMKMSSQSQSNFYLLKSEPDEYSIQHLQRDHREEWNGVRNYTARNHLKAMQVGDRCFFYHSSCKMPSIVGTCRVARAAQPDATAVDPTHKYYDAKSDPEKNNRWVSVLVEFEALFETPITIKELRAQATINPIIAGMTLLRQSRLSVMPVSNDEWQAVLDLQCRKERGEDLEQISTSSNEKSKGTERIKRASSSSISSAQKKKKKKKKKKGNTVALTVDDPGYCSNPDRQLSAEQVEAVRQDTATKITEKDLGLTGRKHLYEIKADGGSTSILVHFYEGNKFIGKDKARMGAMVDAAKQRGHENGKTGDVYLLLSENSGICKRNTLPKLLEEGVTVQRMA